jgi:hypothetical protein
MVADGEKPAPGAPRGKPWLAPAWKKGQSGNPAGRPRGKRDRIYGILDGLRKRFKADDDRTAFMRLVEALELPDLIRFVSLVVPKQEDPDAIPEANEEQLTAAEEQWAGRLESLEGPAH